MSADFVMHCQWLLPMRSVEFSKSRRVMLSSIPRVLSFELRRFSGKEGEASGIRAESLCGSNAI